MDGIAMLDLFILNIDPTLNVNSITIIIIIM